MSRQGALLVMIGVALLLLALLAWSWYRRVRRDRGFTAPHGEIPAGATQTALFAVLYVATTRHGEPLERLAIRGLGFRSRADLTVTSEGVAIDLTGQPRIFLASARIAGVAQASVAIDRVVEPDGLVRIEWRTDEGPLVDSYFRPQDASARALADAVGAILTPTSTGPDA
ncbi:hypothetical protein [Microbacterium sp. BK668]|uniref:PH-like domain-containing protein n=1 Tax=Microbacterium sp. BK668 TaxID=2512118 RepID=UPI0010610C09|nr:hypothetical protein [Microbacterium sp. BK668]TDN92955.1 hypothetical protein EV279_2496 [Microbacterium sp. BK668]